MQQELVVITINPVKCFSQWPKPSASWS